MNTVAKVNLRNQLRIQREFTSSADFMEQVGKRVSAQGMFLAMRSPLTAGTTLEIAFTLPSGRDILRGAAEVAKVQDESASMPAGVWIRFRQLTPRSLKNLELISAWRASQNAG